MAGSGILAAPLAEGLLTQSIPLRLASALAPGLSRPETARTLIEALLRPDLSIRPDPVAGTLSVRLHQASGALALKPLLEELNQTRRPCPGTGLRLIYERLPTMADELADSCVNGSSGARPDNPK